MDNERPDFLPEGVVKAEKELLIKRLRIEARDLERDIAALKRSEKYPGIPEKIVEFQQEYDALLAQLQELEK